MRKLTLSAVVVTAFLLTACGGSGDDTTDSGDRSTESAAPDEGSDAGEDAEGSDEGSGEIADLNAALLTVEDLPEGAALTPIDITQFSSSNEQLAQMMEDITYEPAECGDNSAYPFAREGTEAAAQTAVVGEGMEIDALTNAVYAGASEDDIAAIEDYVSRCGEVSASGTVAGQTIDMTITTTVADAPSTDADHALALDSAVSMSGTEIPASRSVFLVDGDYGVLVGGNPESANFDFDALTQTALDKLRAAQG